MQTSLTLTCTPQPEPSFGCRSKRGWDYWLLKFEVCVNPINPKHKNPKPQNPMGLVPHYTKSRMRVLRGLSSDLLIFVGAYKLPWCAARGGKPCGRHDAWARFMLPRVTKAPLEKVNVPFIGYIGYSGFSFCPLKH